MAFKDLDIGDKDAVLRIMERLKEGVDIEINNRSQRLAKNIKRIIDSSSKETISRMWIKCSSGWGSERGEEMVIEGYGKTVSGAVRDFFKYRALFKKEEAEGGFRIEKAETFEDITDVTQRMIKYSKAKQFARRFLRSYMRLIDSESLDLFYAIMGKEQITPEYIQQNLRKVASYKDSKQLNSALEKVLDSVKISRENILRKIDDLQLNASVVIDEGGLLVVVIGDYQASKELGSSQWCISNDESDFENYVFESLDQELTLTADYYDKYGELLIQEGDPFSLNDVSERKTHKINEGTQIFIYDFQKGEADPLFMVGATITPSGVDYDVFDQNDTELEVGAAAKILGNHYNTVVKECSSGQDIPARFAQEVLLDPFVLLDNTANPTNALRKLARLIGSDETLPEEFFRKTNTDGVNIDPLLWKKSEKYFLECDRENPAQFLEDSIFLSMIIDRLKGAKDSWDSVTAILSGDDEDLKEQYEGEEFVPCNMSLTMDNLSDSEALKLAIENLSDSSRKLIFKKYESYIVAMCEKDYGDHCLVRSINLSREHHFSNGRPPFFLSIAPELLIDSTADSNVKAWAAVLAGKQSKDNGEMQLSEGVKSSLKDLFKNGDISFEKAIGRISAIHNDAAVVLAESVNENPSIIPDNISSTNFNELAKNNYFLQNLSPESVEAIKQSHSNYLSCNQMDYCGISSFSYDDDFVAYYKNAFDFGLLDKEVLNKKIRPRDIPFGVIEQCKNNGTTCLFEAITGEKRLSMPAPRPA